MKEKECLLKRVSLSGDARSVLKDLDDSSGNIKGTDKRRKGDRRL